MWRGRRFVLPDSSNDGGGGLQLPGGKRSEAGLVRGVQVCSSEGFVAVCGLILAVSSVDEALTH